MTVWNMDHLDDHLDVKYGLSFMKNMWLNCCNVGEGVIAELNTDMIIDMQMSNITLMILIIYRMMSNKYVLCLTGNMWHQLVHEIGHLNYSIDGLIRQMMYIHGQVSILIHLFYFPLFQCYMHCIHWLPLCYMLIHRYGGCSQMGHCAIFLRINLIKTVSSFKNFM